MEAFNQNFLASGVTKIVNWYLVASVYPLEPYPEDPALPDGQFALERPLRSPGSPVGLRPLRTIYEIGWQYLNGACGELSDGGTFVTLKSPGKDYSVIVETKDAANISRT